MTEVYIHIHLIPEYNNPCCSATAIPSIFSLTGLKCNSTRTSAYNSSWMTPTTRNELPMHLKADRQKTHTSKSDQAGILHNVSKCSMCFATSLVSQACSIAIAYTQGQERYMGCVSPDVCCSAFPADADHMSGRSASHTCSGGTRRSCTGDI